MVADPATTTYLACMSEPPKTEPPIDQDKPKSPVMPVMPKEIGGPKGPEPTRYGDWEVNGRCTDF